ncbi:EXS family-domain-containing protein [Cryomyces antarcticus]
MYYVAMIVDPIIRFNWIFYVIFDERLQITALLAFFVALTEVCRRGVWTLFRVENEHCTNVGRFRASRDIPLPYELSTPSTGASQSARTSEEAQDSTSANGPRRAPTASAHVSGSRASGADLERAGTHESSPSVRFRRRSSIGGSSPVARGFSRMGTMLHEAHAQDFERKKRPEVGGTEDHGDDDDGGSSDDDDDGEDEEVAAADERAAEEVISAEGLLERAGRDKA